MRASRAQSPSFETLRQTDRTLVKLTPFARELGPTLDALRPAVRQIPAANAATLPLVREGEPIIRREIRPFTRIATPYFRDLGRAGRQLANAGPDISSTFLGLNRLFNIGAFNRGGAEDLTGNLASDRARDEGYLYWLAWTAQNTVSLFSTGDAQGNFRRISSAVSAAPSSVPSSRAPCPGSARCRRPSRHSSPTSSTASAKRGCARTSD